MAERLPAPVRETLDAELDEADIPRLWRGVEARRERRRAARRATVILAVAAALGLAILGGWWLRGADPEPPPDATLSRVDGAPTLGSLPAGARVEYDDGSWIETGAETSASVLSSGPRDFVLHLRSGRIEVQVTPGGPRRWVVEAGAATVEVVGTQFRVERSGLRVRVSVSRGSVVVRHPTLEDGLRRVSAGDAVEVGREAAPPTEPRARAAAPPAEPVAVDEPPALEPSPEPRPTRRAEPSWRELAESGDYEAAYAALGAGGTVRRSTGASAAELMQLADVARHSGHPADAVAPLEQLLAHHATDPGAPMAAFMLGQVELDQLHRPADAARHFERALAAGLPGALAGDARARLALAREQSGDVAGARAAACEYLSEHPEGSRAAAMRRRCPDDPAPTAEAP